MFLEKAESLLRVYSHMNDVERKVVAKAIVGAGPGQFIYPQVLERKGLKHYTIYMAMDNLTKKAIVAKMWQNYCDKCNTPVGEACNDMSPIGDTYCSNCDSEQSTTCKFAYRILQ